MYNILLPVFGFFFSFQNGKNCYNLLSNKGFVIFSRGLFHIM